MKKVMITTAAMALAFGLAPFAGAADPTSITDSQNSGTPTASGASSSAASGERNTAAHT